jgi:hypothetical protein
MLNYYSRYGFVAVLDIATDGGTASAAADSWCLSLNVPRMRLRALQHPEPGEREKEEKKHIYKYVSL